MQSTLITPLIITTKVLYRKMETSAFLPAISDIEEDEPNGQDSNGKLHIGDLCHEDEDEGKKDERDIICPREEM